MSAPQSTWVSFKNLLRASWMAVADERVRFFAFIVLFVAAYSLDLALPWAIGYVLGVFVNQGFTPEAYNKALLGIGAYIGLRMANVFCHHFGRYIQNTVAYSARMAVARQMFTGILTFPLRWHVSHHSGENLARLHRAVGAIDNTIGTYVWLVIEGFVKFVFATVALMALDIRVAGTVISLGLVTVGMMIFFNRKLVSNIRDNNAFYDKLNRTYIDYLFNIITVKTLHLEPAATKRLVEHQPKGLKISQTISKFSELKWGSVSMGYGIVLGTSLWVYLKGHQGFQGAFDVAQVYVLINYLDKIFQAIGSFTGYYSGLIEASTAYEDGHRIVHELSELPRERGVRVVTPDWKVLSVSDLKFSYGENSGIRGIKLDIKKGEKVALVGPSGGGKSTLLKILAGMIPPEQAKVLIDDRQEASIDDVSHVSLLLPQEPEIFSGTVHYNLTVGEPFSDEQLQFFISLCKVEGIVAKLPKGWDSDLAEKGLNLSVGEKQRIAMARGLMRGKDKDILLLDEPTSSLDPMTEKAIFFGLLYHYADRTILTACHRLALVPLFDKIMYIRQGIVEEVGSFKELLAKKGAFASAWEDYERKIEKKDPSAHLSS